MRYIGPDYDEAQGIVLHPAPNPIKPRLMTDAHIAILLAQFPTLVVYFDDNNNNNTGGGSGTTTVVADKNYIHNQVVPSNDWSIIHNLNKYPSVTVVDTAGYEWEVEVQHLSLNQVRIRFTNPFSGKAYFN